MLFNEIPNLEPEDPDKQLAGKNEDKIEIAAKWCIEEYPHKLKFLNDIRTKLRAQEKTLRKFGLEDALRSPEFQKHITPVLLLITAKQALRLLECYERAKLNTKKGWATKNKPGQPALTELERLKRQKELQEIRDRTRQELTEGDSPVTEE